MSSRPHFCKVLGRSGADPTLGFIILKYKVGHDTSAENHLCRLPKPVGTFTGTFTLEF